jgi:UTP--glucose-1-phosphate uridylyltransferase
MTAVKDNFRPFAERMEAEGLPEVVVRNFRHYYTQLTKGSTGMIPEAQIRPIEELSSLENLSSHFVDAGRSALSQSILLKLNGGLGTGMGLERAKSLLVVKDDLTFLDVIARQALYAHVPLVLMNSFSTRADSLALLAKYPELQGKIPPDFLQHKVPRYSSPICLRPIGRRSRSLNGARPATETSTRRSSRAGSWIRCSPAGYRYAFVSNADNLGAELDPQDPRLLRRARVSRSSWRWRIALAADRKGGHIARRADDGRLILRESAQCPDPKTWSAFQDTERHRYFNTNNLWLNLRAL